MSAAQPSEESGFSWRSLPELLRTKLSDTQRYTLLWILAGVVCGLVAVLFHVCIDALFDLVLVTAKGLGTAGFIAMMLLAPTLGGLISGLVVNKIAPAASGSGIPQTKAAYYLNFGVLSLREALWRFVIGTISVGSGMSLGREGPTVHICAAISSKLGQVFGLAKKRVQAMVPVGMGAGIAAAFNTPLAAMFFVFEELLGDFSSKALFGILVAVVISATVERSLLGEHPAFDIGLPAFETDWWMLLAIPLGVIAALLGHFFIKCLLRSRLWFKECGSIGRILQPAAGGLGVGLVGIAVYFMTQGKHHGVFAIGYKDLSDALNGRIDLLHVLLFLLIGKFVATILAYSSGGSGGLFAPALFIGGMLGGVFGLVAQPVFHYDNNVVGAIALLGMGAFFAAVIRCPMTSIMIIFEMTRNYAIILPLMTGNMIAWLLSKRLQPVALYDSLLLQDKVSIRKFSSYQGEQDWRNLPLSSIMTFDVMTLNGDIKPGENLAVLDGRRKHAYPVVNTTGELLGVMTHHELERHISQNPGRLIRDLLSEHQLVLLTPEKSIRDAANTLVVEDVEQAPVVSATDPKKLLGILTLHDIARQQNAISEGMGR